MTTRFNELSQRVRLESFEQQDFYKNASSDDHINLWVLYRYPKSAAFKEKQRLATEQKAESKIEFSTVGAESAVAGGVLEITTNPIGASVYIDHESFGRTPLRLIGQVESGGHLLRLELPNHESVEEQVAVPTGKTVRVSKTLARATGTLTINTNPTNATVSIAGRVYSTPTGPIALVAGEKNELVITHPDAERYSQTIEVGASESRPITLTLPLKPAYLSLNTEPSGATVTLGDAEISTPTGFKRVDPGEYTLIFRRNGFQDATINIAVRGGQRLALPTVKMVPMSEVERQKRSDTAALQQERFKRSQNPFSAGANISVSGPTSKSKTTKPFFQFGLSLDRRFSWIGLRGEFGYELVSNSDEDNSHVRGKSLTFAIPLYLSDLSRADLSAAASTTYLEPSCGRIWQTYSRDFSYPQQGGERLSMARNFVGLNLGWRFYGPIEFGRKRGIGSGFNVKAGALKYLDLDSSPGNTTYLIIIERFISVF